MENRKLFVKYKKGEHWENRNTDEAERFAKFLISKKSNSLIVDMGCGGGRDVALFTRKGFKTIGIDISKWNIKKAKINFPNLDFRVGNIENLEFDNSSIDAIFNINVIHYVDKEKTIKEFFRVLKPGGYLFIHFNLEILDEKGIIDYQQSKEKVLSLISNFKIISRRDFNRIDLIPKKHTHHILELLLAK